MKAAVIIPVHNRREVTLACLRRLIDDGVPAWAKVIVVDDGSTDGTSAAVARLLPGATILQGTGDWWWTGAIARGMEAAIAAGCGQLVWLNDDTLPAPGTLSRLCAVSAERRAIAGGSCLVPGTTEVVYGGHLRRGFGFAMLPFKPGAIESCDALSGNLVCVPGEVVDRIGLPDALRLPHAMADLDYTLRARRAGVSVLVVHDAVAQAVPNAWDNYASWLCSDVPVTAIWRGLWNKGSYSYLPAQWTFFTRHWGWRGSCHVAWLVAKRLPITLLRCTTTLAWRQRRWGGRSRAWQEEQRLRDALAAGAGDPGTRRAGRD
jgi:hypothetical protein